MNATEMAAAIAEHREALAAGAASMAPDDDVDPAIDERYDRAS
jgi:hypothetical protein